MQRMTKQRSAIFDLLHKEAGFLSAQEVYEKLRAQGSDVGLATIYRNLQTLADNKQVDVLRAEDSDIQLFRYCREDTHHHHLVCRACGKTVDITWKDFESWARQIAQENNFSSVSHSLELYGICADCTPVSDAE